jgi:ribosome-associated heat shock protein Hsp15
MRQRSDCAALVGRGSVRINRQPTDKPHARLRVGDVLTVPVRGSVRVVRVLALAGRRGPATEARLLYEEISEAGDLAPERNRRHIAGSDSRAGDPT